MIATTPSSKLSIARRAETMLVAFESFTKRTPSNLGDRFERVLQTAESFDGAAHRGGGTPATQPTAAAASTSPSRCRPGSRTDDSGISGTARPSSRRTISPPASPTPFTSTLSCAKSNRRAFAPRASAIDAGSSALITAQSSGV